MPSSSSAWRRLRALLSSRLNLRLNFLLIFLILWSLWVKSKGIIH